MKGASKKITLLDDLGRLFKVNEREFDAAFEKEKNNLIALNLSYDDLLEKAATNILMREKYRAILTLITVELKEELARYSKDVKLVNEFLSLAPKLSEMMIITLPLFIDKKNQAVDSAAKEGVAIHKKRQAVLAANARHSKPGGSRDKQEKIRSIWASGKYLSRDLCAEQECSHLGMSFSAARKALRNTPNPD